MQPRPAQPAQPGRERRRGQDTPLAAAFVEDNGRVHGCVILLRRHAAEFGRRKRLSEARVDERGLGGRERGLRVEQFEERALARPVRKVREAERFDRLGDGRAFERPHPRASRATTADEERQLVIPFGRI